MNPVNAQDYIQKHQPMKWSRSTIADGKWMQDNTLTPLNANDEQLGIYIDKVVEGLNAEIADRSNLTEVVNEHTTEIGQIKDNVHNIDTVVNEHTTEIGQIQDAIHNVNSSLTDKKDKQAELAFNGSATKTIKSITQNTNGEINVEYEDIDLPQEVPNVEITSDDNSIDVVESTDSQTNIKTFDLSVNESVKSKIKDIKISSDTLVIIGD